MKLAAALLAGALQVLAYQPFGVWPLAVIAPAALYILLRTALNAAEGTRLGLAYGIGLFAAGAHWVFFSVYNFGTGEVFSALAATAILVLLAGAFYAALGFGFVQLRARGGWDAWIFAALWVILELLRGAWVFPWLNLGHSIGLHSGWLAVIGAFGVSWLLALSGALAVSWGDWSSNGKRWMACVLVWIWVGAPLLALVSWGSPRETFTAALVQPNIPQHLKWRDGGAYGWADSLINMSDKAIRSGALVVWPEVAVTLPYSEIHQGLHRTLAGHPGSGLIYGVAERSQLGGSYNVMAGAGLAAGHYRKRQLVPFGEYTPVEPLLGDILGFFDARRPRTQAGNDAQPLLRYRRSVLLAPAICYEIAYADLVRRDASKAGVIVTISNDAWFGDSIGPQQHLQIAQVRAMENARPVLRATNDGVSAFIGADGRVLQRLAKGERGVIGGEVISRHGLTPWQYTGRWPVLLIAMLCLAMGLYRRGLLARSQVQGAPPPEPPPVSSPVPSPVPSPVQDRSQPEAPPVSSPVPSPVQDRPSPEPPPVSSPVPSQEPNRVQDTPPPVSGRVPSQAQDTPPPVPSREPSQVQGSPSPEPPPVSSPVPSREPNRVQDRPVPSQVQDRPPPVSSSVPSQEPNRTQGAPSPETPPETPPVSSPVPNWAQNAPRHDQGSTQSPTSSSNQNQQQSDADETVSSSRPVDPETPAGRR